MAAMMENAAGKLGFKSTRDCLLGEYDYKHYCTPKWPYGKGVKASLPPFFGLKEKMPILLGMLMVRQSPQGQMLCWLLIRLCSRPSQCLHMIAPDHSK